MKVRQTTENMSDSAVNRGSDSPPVYGTAKSPAGRTRSDHPLNERTGSGRILIRLIDSVISRLDRNNKIHNTLVPLLNLVRQMPSGPDGLPLNSKDRELFLKVLDLWKTAHGSSLDQKTLKEIGNMERLIQYDDSPNILFLQKPTTHLPGILIRGDDSSPGKKAEGESERLDMILELKELGRFQIILDQKGPDRSCTILTEKLRSFRKLKGERKKLIERIAERGFLLSVLKIRNRPPSVDVADKNEKRGIQVWG